MNEGFNRRIFNRWVGATWLGWLLGIPAIIALALLGEMVGIGGSQVLVGLGMGLGVGFTQSRVLRRFISSSTAWLTATTVGLGMPFLLYDIAKLADMPVTYSLYAAVAAGGLIVGVWQMALWRRSGSAASWRWVPASLLGWGLAAGSAALADFLFQSGLISGIWGMIGYLSVVASGGVVLGVTTAPMLVRMLKTPQTLP